jgi:MSHA biogenesis protein MshG
MISVAEKTGELDKVFFELANYYDSECQYAVDNIGGIIEPILILIVSVMVLILALGVFLPMWDMTTVAFR